MTRVALDGFHIAAIEFQLVSDAGVAERMEHNMRQSVFFDKFIESTVNYLAFHRTAIAGAKDQVIVDVFISKQIHQLINFFFSLYQHIGNCFRQVHTANTGFGFRLFQDQSSMGTGYARWKLLNTYPSSLE